MDTKQQLIDRLQSNPNDESILSLVQTIEKQSVVDLERDLSLLKGVWELRWSSSTQPWLKQAAWLENLQILDPEKQKGMNLLRAKGVFGSLAGIAVEAELTTNQTNQVGVEFKKGGWIGPSFNGGKRLKLLAKINQAFPAWLEITYIDHHLRLCRGNAGTVFALLKRQDLSVAEWIPPFPDQS